MSISPSQYLEKPLLSSPGQPLRVAVYSRIAHGIRSGVFATGTALPRETELGVALGVSRTVVREALMLLEEDGLTLTRRGVGRFVADAIPYVGLEEFRPLDQVLSEPDAVIEVRGVEVVIQDTTDFVAINLKVPLESQIWFREAIVYRDNSPIAVVQEYLPLDAAPSGFSQAVAHAMPAAAELPATVLHSILQQTGLVLSSGECRIAASVAGATRAKQLGVKASDPVLLLTQTADLNGKPVYLAKCVITSAVGHIAVRQSAAG